MSGRKNVIQPIKIADATSLGASFNSSPVNIQYLDRVSIAINATATAGSANGTFALQGRVSPSSGVQAGPAAEWGPLDIGGAITLTGADKNVLIDVIATGYVELRVIYTRSSGTGSVTIYVSAKEV